MLLLLAGTREARQLAEKLAADKIPAIATLAGATRGPIRLALPTHRGGFGGPQGFRDFLREHQIKAVLDATHPFAERISLRSAEITAQLGVDYLQVLRPAWTAKPGDRWTEIADEAEAADHIPGGATVFLATGRQTLQRFEKLAHCRLICRQIDPPNGPFPFPDGRYLVGRPPFSVVEEKALFARLAVDWLVVKNAGGSASATKLTAARDLGLPVAMIRRPNQMRAPRVETVAAAMQWVRAQPW